MPDKQGQTRPWKSKPDNLIKALQPTSPAGRFDTLHLGEFDVPLPRLTPHLSIRSRGGLRNTVTMPTPESAMFQAQKPKVPPTFDGVDYDDNKAFKAAQDAITREQWVGAMMLRLVGKELNKCYTREGVNHLENCGHLRGNILR